MLETRNKYYNKHKTINHKDEDECHHTTHLVLLVGVPGDGIEGWWAAQDGELVVRDQREDESHLIVGSALHAAEHLDKRWMRADRL